MPERKIKTPWPLPAGPLVDAADVPVKESTERWSEITLEDGSVLRLKPSIVQAIRIEGQYDPEGNPTYILKASQLMVIASAPAHLRKGGTGSKGIN